MTLSRAGADDADGVWITMARVLMIQLLLALVAGLDWEDPLCIAFAIHARNAVSESEHFFYRFAAKAKEGFGGVFSFHF